jgi:hypothetical protein
MARLGTRLVLSIRRRPSPNRNAPNARHAIIPAAHSARRAQPSQGIASDLKKLRSSDGRRIGQTFGRTGGGGHPTP